jgi:hypothetical protein
VSTNAVEYTGLDDRRALALAAALRAASDSAAGATSALATGTLQLLRCRGELAGGQLGPQGAAALMGAVTMASLTCLDLSQNALGSAGLCTLAGHAPFLPLRTLNLSSSRFVGCMPRWSTCLMPCSMSPTPPHSPRQVHGPLSPRSGPA